MNFQPSTTTTVPQALLIRHWYNYFENGQTRSIKNLTYSFMPVDHNAIVRKALLPDLHIDWEYPIVDNGNGLEAEPRLPETLEKPLYIEKEGVKEVEDVACHSVTPFFFQPKHLWHATLKPSCWTRSTLWHATRSFLLSFLNVLTVNTLNFTFMWHAT
jgi:hypothetical protein